MLIRRIALLIALAADLAITPFSTATAQYYLYGPPCSPFPLAWPFCAAGAIVGTTVNVVTAPFWVPAGAPPPFYAPSRFAPPPPVYYPPQPYYSPAR